MRATSKKKGAGLMSLDFKQIAARFIPADPKAVADALAADFMQSHEKAKANIEKARREIDDGARPRKGRFRI